MYQTNNPIIKHKVGLLNLAEELNNVSKAFKIMGVSRDTFYRYQELVNDGEIDALINQNRRVPNLKNRIDEQIESAVVEYAVTDHAKLIHLVLFVHFCTARVSHRHIKFQKWLKSNG